MPGPVRVTVPEFVKEPEIEPPMVAGPLTIVIVTSRMELDDEAETESEPTVWGELTEKVIVCGIPMLYLQLRLIKHKYNLFNQ
jgi:hypothetical protein